MIIDRKNFLLTLLLGLFSSVASQAITRSLLTLEIANSELVSQNADQQKELIKKRWKVLQRTCHPGKGGNNDKSQALNRAKDCLLNVLKKQSPISQMALDKDLIESIQKGLVDEREHEMINQKYVQEMGVRNYGWFATMSVRNKNQLYNFEHIFFDAFKNKEYTIKNVTILDCYLAERHSYPLAEFRFLCHQKNIGESKAREITKEIINAKTKGTTFFYKILKKIQSASRQDKEGYYNLLFEMLSIEGVNVDDYPEGSEPPVALFYKGLEVRFDYIKPDYVPHYSKLFLLRSKEENIEKIIEDYEFRYRTKVVTITVLPMVIAYLIAILLPFTLIFLIDFDPVVTQNLEDEPIAYTEESELFSVDPLSLPDKEVVTDPDEPIAYA